MMQRMTSWLGYLLFALISLVLIANGWSMIAASRAERTLASAHLVALGDLATVAGTGKRVRVAATALAEPLLQTAGGERLALQYVRVEHTEGDDEDQRTVVDYEYVAPAELLIGDGVNVARVRAQQVDPRFLQRQLQIDLDAQGALPAEARAGLAPIFNDVPAVPNARLSVWNIPAQSRVTVYGTVTLEHGQPVLHAPADAPFFVISPLPFSEVVARATTSSRLGMILGVGMVLLPVVFAGLAWWRSRPRRTVQTAASPAA